jgi:tRNA/rRNA methyltransferase
MILHFVLVEPAVPENIGAAARAIKTMGFESLILVNPSGYPNEKALWLAHGSKDILDHTEIASSLQAIMGRFDLIVGTTAKKRSVKVDYHPPGDLFKILAEKGTTVSSVALVFGREESGLTNEELSLCHIVSTIPMRAPYPSLNLAQAVMIYAYVMSPLALPATKHEAAVPDQQSFNVMQQRVSVPDRPVEK